MKSHGIWSDLARADALGCYRKNLDGSLSGEFFHERIAEIVERAWTDPMADETLTALLELIVRRGDGVPPSLRYWAVQKINGRAGPKKRPPWPSAEQAERDTRIWWRITALRRERPDMPMHHTRERKGDGTSIFETVAEEEGMTADAVAKVWTRENDPDRATEN